jgi:hypothetical protein
MLTRRYAFREVAALVGAGACGKELTTRGGARVQQLCEYGQRMLDLDADDLANPDAIVRLRHSAPVGRPSSPTYSSRTPRQRSCGF